MQNTLCFIGKISPWRNTLKSNIASQDNLNRSHHYGLYSYAMQNGNTITTIRYKIFCVGANNLKIQRLKYTGL